MLNSAGIRAELAALKAATSRPFNVNFFCHHPPAPEPDREARWRAALAPYYREFGIDPAAVPSGAGRNPFDAAAAQILCEVRPAVVSFHFGLPPADLLAAARASGAKIIASATTVAEARWLEAQGVDAIVAQGVEAGGHRGNFLSDDLSTQLGTFALVPQVVRAVNLPVIAAGGIADTQGLRAALALGAAGVQVGSAYLLCPEATVSAIHRAALQSSVTEHTALTNVFTGRPARGIVNRLMRELGPISAAPPTFPLATAAIAPLRAKAEASGSGDFSPLWCGQNATACQPLPAAELTRQLAGI
jgi:nitronate monooxygenase